MTSNRTRELHDALKRRCLYHWIDYPSPAREAEIVHARLPGVSDEVAGRVCAAVARLRGEDLYKLPGVGETIAWAQALLALDSDDLEETLGVALKVREDIDQVRERGLLRDLAPRGHAVKGERPGARLTGRLTLLVASMRAGGARVGIGELLAAHRALAAIDPSDRSTAYFALRASLCSRRDDLEAFDAAFAEWFSAPPPETPGGAARRSTRSPRSRSRAWRCRRPSCASRRRPRRSRSCPPPGRTSSS